MIRLIAAIDRQCGIGKHGGQPWHIPDDEVYFTEQTKSHGGNILVGSTTFRTFKSPLPDRQNYLLTSQKEPVDGMELVHNLEKYLADYQDQDLWVIGGANVFAQVMELGRADELYLTRIEADFGCQQFFPDYEADFELAGQSELHEQNGFIFSYLRFIKKLV